MGKDIKKTRLYNLCNNVKTKCTKATMAKILGSASDVSDALKKVWKLVKPESTNKKESTDSLKADFRTSNENIIMVSWHIFHDDIPKFRSCKENFTEDLCKKKITELNQRIERVLKSLECRCQQNVYFALFESEKDFKMEDFDEITEEAWKVMKKSVVDATKEEIDKINELY